MLVLLIFVERVGEEFVLLGGLGGGIFWLF